MTARTKPPFRADHVGSILRSAAIKDARAKHEAGKLPDAELKAVEDREIEKIVNKQQEISCPKCSSKKATIQLSVFATAGSGGPSSSSGGFSGGGGCCGGGCSCH